MVIIRSTQASPKTGVRGFSSSGSESPVSYEIPNKTIAGGITVLSIIATIITAIGNYVGNMPAQKTSDRLIDLREQYFKIEVLQRVLEADSEKQRAASLKLLVAADILKDPTGNLNKLADNPKSIPQWSHRELESAAIILNSNMTVSIPATSNIAADSKITNSNAAGSADTPDKDNATTTDKRIDKK